jgi:hypothetical protein
MGFENAHRCAQNADNGFDFDFLDRYHKDGDETWVSFVNVGTKEPSKLWMYTHSPNNPRKFKQTLSACQKADGNCFLAQESCSEGVIHATVDYSNVRIVFRNNNTKKMHMACHSEPKEWNAHILCIAHP